MIFINSILGNRIKSLRQIKGLTQKQVAESINYSLQKYDRIEKGIIDISYSSLKDIAEALGIKVEEIISVINDDNCKEELVDDDKFKFIMELIDAFYAHRKLYYSVRPFEKKQIVRGLKVMRNP